MKRRLVVSAVIAIGAIAIGGGAAAGSGIIARLPGQTSIFNLAPPPPVGSSELIPYGAAGYRAMVYPSSVPADWGQPAFDDSAFDIAPAAFGSPPRDPTDLFCSIHADVQSPTWPDGTNLVVRKTFVLPAGASNVRVQLAYDNGVTVEVNGVDIGSNFKGGCAGYDDSTFAVADSILNPGDNLVAVLAADTGGEDFLDLRVLADLSITDTPTSTPTATHTATPTDTATNTPTNTRTSTPTPTNTPSPTNTPTRTPTPTVGAPGSVTPVSVGGVGLLTVGGHDLPSDPRSGSGGISSAGLVLIAVAVLSTVGLAGWYVRRRGTG